MIQFSIVALNLSTNILLFFRIKKELEKNFFNYFAYFFRLKNRLKVKSKL
jgi:hypothetical protein